MRNGVANSCLLGTVNTGGTPVTSDVELLIMPAWNIALSRRVVMAASLALVGIAVLPTRSHADPPAYVVDSRFPAAELYPSATLFPAR